MENHQEIRHQEYRVDPTLVEYSPERTERKWRRLNQNIGLFVVFLNVLQNL